MTGLVRPVGADALYKWFAAGKALAQGEFISPEHVEHWGPRGACPVGRLPEPEEMTGESLIVK